MAKIKKGSFELGFKTFQMDEKPHRAAGSPNPSISLSEPLQSRDVLN